MDEASETRFNFIIVKGSTMKLKTKAAVVTAILFAIPCGIVCGQIPITPQNRIVEGKIYNPQKSQLWIDITTNVTKKCSSLKVTSIGNISIICDAFKELLDDGGTYGVYRVIGEEYVKTILIYNHPAHDAMTTGTVIYAGRFKKRVESPTTKPFLAMRVANWRTNDLVLEAYDCGLPDTVENRKNAGIPIPTAADLKELAGRELSTQAAAKEAKEDRTLKWNQAQADKGDAFGLLRMGERYRDGDGVPKDLSRAREYFSKASAAGSPTAAESLSKLNQASTNAPATAGTP